MNESKTQEKENPMIFMAVIIIALGVVGYNWYQEHDIVAIFYSTLPSLITIGILFLFFLMVICSILGMDNTTFKFIAKMLFHTISFLIIGLFIYRIIIKYYDLLFIEHLILSIIIFIYYNYRLHKKIFDNKYARKEYGEKVSKQHAELKKLLDKHVYSSKEMEEQLTKLKGALITFEPEARRGFGLISRIEDLEVKIGAEKEREEMYEIYTKKELLKKEVEEIQERKRRELETEEDKNRKVIDEMETYKNTVFKKSDLNNEQIALLKEEEYIPANEYDLLERKVIPVYIEKTMNHSRTHTFLVWSTKRLIEKKFKVERLEWHDTKDADITFKHKGKYYAIEIETGTLLKKNRQLAEKIKFLNRKYPHRWIFLVSNRNLLTQYKKYGITCQRNDIEKTLLKILQINTLNLHPKIKVHEDI
jgi:hypothetical protein